MARRILHVDHEQHIGRLVKANLDRAGYDCITVHTVENFFAQLDGIDCVIIGDIDAKDNKNWEVLRRLKSNIDTRDIPVMMLTKRDADEDVFRCWQGGSDCYLGKPFNPLEVLSFVRRILTLLEEGEEPDGGDK